MDMTHSTSTASMKQPSSRSYTNSKRRSYTNSKRDFETPFFIDKAANFRQFNNIKIDNLLFKIPLNEQALNMECTRKWLVMDEYDLYAIHNSNAWTIINIQNPSKFLCFIYFCILALYSTHTHTHTHERAHTRAHTPHSGSLLWAKMLSKRHMQRQS